MATTKSSLVLLLIALLWSCSEPNSRPLHADDGVTIEVKNGPVTVLDSRITVGDVAVISCENNVLEQRIRDLDLDQLTDGRTEAAISREQIRMRILLAGCPDSIDFRGEHLTTVVLSSRKDVARTIELFVESAFARQFQLPKAEMRIRLLDGADSPEIASLGHSLESATVVFPTEMPIGEESVRLDCINDTGGNSSLTLRFRFTMTKEFVVARHPLREGMTVTADDVTPIRRPVDDLEFIPATMAETIGRAVNADIPEHGVVRASHLTVDRQDIQLQRNDLVDVIVNREGLRIRLKNAQVLTPGSLGSTVQVLNPNTQKRISAVVIDKSLVEIK